MKKCESGRAESGRIVQYPFVCVLRTRRSPYRIGRARVGHRRVSRTKQVDSRLRNDDDGAVAAAAGALLRAGAETAAHTAASAAAHAAATAHAAAVSLLILAIHHLHHGRQRHPGRHPLRHRTPQIADGRADAGDAAREQVCGRVPDIVRQRRVKVGRQRAARLVADEGADDGEGALVLAATLAVGEFDRDEMREHLLRLGLCESGWVRREVEMEQRCE